MDIYIKKTYCLNIFFCHQKSCFVFYNFDERNRLHFSSNDPINTILWKFGHSKELPYHFLSRPTEVLLTFQRMCKEDYNWKKHGSQRIREYTDRDLTDVKERFSRSPHLVSYFSGRLKNAWKLQNQVKELDMGVYYSLKSGKSQLRTVFTNEILSEKTRMVCKCEDFFRVAQNIFLQTQ